MKTYLEIHALQSVPPANLNRDDTGAPKSATYGGVQRARVSSQAWKRAIRMDFSSRVDPKLVGTRSTQLVQLLAAEITRQAPSLEERAGELGQATIEAVGIKVAAPKRKNAEAKLGESGYLVFLSHLQIARLAEAAIAVADQPDVVKALKEAKVKSLVDQDHSIDIALFGRMVAELTDLNVDAACQVAHALGVHELTPEFDYFTAVDDQKVADEEAGAGMIGTVEFNASTFYRYAVVNVDLLVENLGSADAARLAVEEFVRSFIQTVPSGKQNTFAHGTRPDAVMVTVGQGQPCNLVGAFEDPVLPDNGYMKPAVERLARQASEVFTTWRRPKQVLVCGLGSVVKPLANVEGAQRVSFEDLIRLAGEQVLAVKDDL